MFGFRDDYADPLLLEDAFARMAAGCGMAMGLVDALVHTLRQTDPLRYTVLRRQRRLTLDQIGYAFSAYDAAHGQRGDGPAARAFRERWLAREEDQGITIGEEDGPPPA